MSEADAEEPAELDRPVQLRRCAVLFGTDPENPVPDPDYPIGVLELVDEEVGVTATVAVASICEIDNRVLVAVPFEAWHRLLAKRRLPPDTFLKATPVTLGFCDRASSSSEILDQRKCWLGFPSPLGEQLAKYEDGEVAVEPDVSFDPTSPSVLPEAYQLVAAAEHHFIYASATSGQAEASSRKAPKAAVEDRLSILEATLQEVASGLKQLTEAKRPSALKQPAVTFSGPPIVVDPTSGPCGFPPGLTRPPVVGVGALDADVVQSARAAGVPEDHIAEMARLAMRGKTKLQGLPAPRSRARSSQNPLSESEDEEVEQEEDQGGASGTEPTQLVAAVTQLTKIASHLTNQKKKGQTLDALLDGAGSASTSEGGIPSGSRRYAVALKALRRTLTKNPQEIYQAIEKNMETDFLMRTPAPGSSAVAVNSRAWLEMRSRVQNFATPLRLLWGIAGVLDCLRDGLVSEARARCCLLLAAGDQLSIDRGSWLVSQEILLEEGPPVAAFSQHVLPTDTEPPHTRLIDGRWVDLFLQKISDYDALAEKKKKLGAKRYGAPGADSPAISDKGKGEKGKGKGKGRKSQGGGSADGAGDNAPAPSQ